MSEPTEDPQPEIRADELTRLSEEFRAAANKLEGAAAKLEAAAQSLQKEQEKNRELQRQVDELKKAAAPSAPPAAVKPQGELFTVFIDSSKSMFIRSLHTNGQTKSPVKEALEATLTFSKSGAHVKAAFWGDKAVHPIVLDGADPEVLAKPSGRRVTPEFAPVVDCLKAAVDKPQHFIILADADFHTEKGVLPKILEALAQQPKSTIDFVMIGDKAETDMARFAGILAYEYPAQVAFKMARKDGNLAVILKSIAAARSEQFKKPEVLMPGSPSVKSPNP